MEKYICSRLFLRNCFVRLSSTSLTESHTPIFSTEAVQKLAKFVRNAAIVGFVGGVVSLTGIICINESEEWRMASKLRNGNYASDKRQTFEIDLELCGYRDQFSDIKSAFEGSGSFVGLIGQNSTGTSTTLYHFACENKKNSIYCRINPNNFISLSESIYHKMYEGIFKLPFPLRSIRIRGRGTSLQNIIRKVFSQALGDDLNQRVSVYVDFDYEEDKKRSAAEALVATTMITDNVPTPFSASAFIRQVKLWCQNEQYIHCMFATSDILMFEQEAQQERRLRLFRLSELSVEMAKRYLSTKYQYTCPDDSWLMMIPRDFQTLSIFAEREHKQTFVQSTYESQVRLLQDKLEPTHTWNAWVSKLMSGKWKQSKTALYRVALKRDVYLSDIKEAGMTEDQFNKEFVDTNIFRPSEFLAYTFQFDCVRLAMEQVVREY